MADSTIQLLREQDPETLDRFHKAFDPLLEPSFARSPGLSGLSFQRFAEAVFQFLAQKSSSEKAFALQVEALKDLPDLPLLIGILAADATATQVAMERVRSDLQYLRETCEAALPGVGLGEDEFLDAVLSAAVGIGLRRCLSLLDAISRGIRFPDFYLSTAILSKNSKVSRKACEMFTKRYLKLAHAYVRKRWATVPNAEEKVSALLFCSLYPHTLSEKTGNPSSDDTQRPPLLSEYRGQGPLAAWLTLALGNMIRDSLRTAKQHDSIDEEREFGAEGSSLPKTVVSVEGDQRASMDRNRCVKILQEGLKEAWQTLKPREKLTLTLQTLMEVPPSVIARNIFHVHEGTITKYTTNALTKIREVLLRHARATGNLSEDEVEGCFEYLREAFPETETLAGGIVAAAGHSETHF